MWMQYSSQQWPEAENLNLAVDRLSCELNALSFEAEHETVYGNSCFDEESVEHHINLAEKYHLGANLCQKYIYNMLDLGEFCQAMVDLGLKSFLFPIERHLPEAISVKFGLNEENDDATESDEEEDK